MAGAAHFGITLLVGESVERALDLTEGSVRTEDLHVGAEVRIQRVDGLRWCRLRGTRDECSAEEGEAGCGCGKPPPPGVLLGEFRHRHAMVLSIEGLCGGCRR